MEEARGVGESWKEGIVHQGEEGVEESARRHMFDYHYYEEEEEEEERNFFCVCSGKLEVRRNIGCHVVHPGVVFLAQCG